MEAKFLFVILTVFLTFLFFFVESFSNRNDVISHWSERRCDFDVLLTAFLYKPSDDHRSSSKFTSENFNFCISSKSANYLRSIFGVLYELMRKQFVAGDIMTDVMKTLRSQLNTIYAPFSSMMKKFWVKFVQIGSLSSRIFQQLYMTMKKASGIAVASLFIALSLQTTVMNSIDFVIKVIMIVLYILLALIFVWFYPILPWLIMVLITVFGIEKAMPGKTGPLGGLFCFAKGTRVILENGDTRPIESLKPGDYLLNANLVQGIIEVPGEPLYNLDGIFVSGYHSMYYNGEKIYIKDHPRAILTKIYDKTLWTLITEKREIQIHGKEGILRFLDWDEIPDTQEANKGWNQIVCEMLNGPKYNSLVPKYAPCLDATIRVNVNQSGWVNLSEIQIGDWISCKSGWTRITGKARRRVQGGFGSLGSRMSDGVWILGSNGKWDHFHGTTDQMPWEGVHLITDSGEFKIKILNGNEYIVRDFTEVGSDKIFESDVRIESLLK